MTDSATFTTPEASDEDLGDLLLEVPPPAGSTIPPRSNYHKNWSASTVSKVTNRHMSSP
jgi:hypothetical protein